MASFVITLARETGWSEDFILNELPLSRALQYRHCILRAAGYWTVPPSAEPASQLAAVKAAMGKAADRKVKMMDDDVAKRHAHRLAPVPSPPLVSAQDAMIAKWIGRN